MLSDLPETTQPVSGRAKTPKILLSPLSGGGEGHSANLTIFFRSPLFSTEITFQETKRTTEVQGCGSEFSPTYY